MTPYDVESFSAGQQTGARVAAITARLAALELMDESRWWNRRRHRLMARALVAHAEEMEGAADEASSVSVAAGTSRARAAGSPLSLVEGPAQRAVPARARAAVDG